MSCASSFFAVFAIAFAVIFCVVVLIIIMAVKNAKNGPSNSGSGIDSVYSEANTFPSAPVRPAQEEGEAHKCSSCGATFKGAVCPYCDTPYTE